MNGGYWIDCGQVPRALPWALVGFAPSGLVQGPKRLAIVRHISRAAQWMCRDRARPDLS